ncbi:MAG: radical SAM protein [Spirochaetes bacterium]|nr:radical SAM protein [Spirochaetota bacterium]
MNPIRYLQTVSSINRNRTVLPSMLTFITTFRCNAKCIMCDSWKKKQADDLNTQEIEKIFYQLPRMDFTRLSGGEPFIRNDIHDIYDMCVKILDSSAVHITTNGFLTEKIVNLCEKRNRAKPLFLLLSLDGTEDNHNYIRGRRNAWKLANRTLSYLGPRQKELNIRLNVNQTIVDNEGIAQHDELRKHLSQFDIGCNVVIAYDSSATYSTDISNSSVPGQIGEFSPFGKLDTEGLSTILSLPKKHSGWNSLAERTAKKYYYAGIRNRLFYKFNSPNPKCVALNSHLRIMPDGTVPVCQFNSAAAGNLRTQTFSEIWNSRKTEHLREWIRTCPGCWAECEILPNAVYSGDILRHVF